MTRCSWCGTDPLYVRYHDEEWGVPLHDDRRLFEMLILEGAQAGLSWITILRKRPAYRKAFDRFDAKKISRYDAAKKRALLADAGIVRNRLKIDAAIANARAFLRNAPIPLVSTYSYVNPLVAILLGYFLGKEILAVRVLLAAGLIIGSVVLVSATKR